MYNSIHLNTEEISNYKTSSSNEITNLSKINIFIGPNNSGKSRFLRGLFSNKNTKFKSNDINLTIINEAISELKNNIQKYYEAANISSAGGINLDLLMPIDFLTNAHELKSIIYDHVIRLRQIKVNAITRKHGSSSVTPSDVSSYVQNVSEKCLSKINFLETFEKSKIQHEHIYVPTLRGLRGIDYDSNSINLRGGDNYQIRTKHDYFKDITHIEYQIYTGLSLYNDVKKLLLGSSSDRAKIKNFERFISETFFDSKEFTIIPHINDNAVHVKIGDEDDYPIYRLGEGIQSIIILTYPLFFNQGENLCVFYEEPDLFLHPGFQRIFIETLNKFPEFQFFMTTHSNHFLDMTLDFNSISIYTFRKNEKKEFFIENVKNDNLNILELLGVKNSSVFLSNCTIWVEGITDRIYIRKFLELYYNTTNNAFKEDIHYSFVEYGGGNITHWSFLDTPDPLNSNINVEKLCGKLFLISDQDGANSNRKAERHEELKSRLKDRYYCLNAREIENLLKENIIISTIKSYDKTDCSAINFSKIIQSKYEKKLLGKYIDENVAGLSRRYSAKSGTINDKVEFAKTAVSYMENYDDLSDEAKLLTEKIYNFIQINNPK